MDAVFRATAVYLFVWLLLRLAGRRTLGELTSFDFVLLLILAETTQQALLGEDLSVTNAFLLIVTLTGIDVVVSLLKRRYPQVDRIMDGEPLLLVDDGRPLRERMHRARVGEADILEAARRLRGLERMDQIKYAILEHTGGISIIAKEQAS
jgi:uncharacterized membrane protein YcaP (DUF421 family)